MTHEVLKKHIKDLLFLIQRGGNMLSEATLDRISNTLQKAADFDDDEDDAASQFLREHDPSMQQADPSTPTESAGVAPTSSDISLEDPETLRRLQDWAKEHVAKIKEQRGREADPLRNPDRASRSFGQYVAQKMGTGLRSQLDQLQSSPEYKQASRSEQRKMRTDVRKQHKQSQADFMKQAFDKELDKYKNSPELQQIRNEAVSVRNEADDDFHDQYHQDQEQQFRSEFKQQNPDASQRDIDKAWTKHRNSAKYSRQHAQDHSEFKSSEKYPPHPDEATNKAIDQYVEDWHDKNKSPADVRAALAHKHGDFSTSARRGSQARSMEAEMDIARGGARSTDVPESSAATAAQQLGLGGGGAGSDEAPATSLEGSETISVAQQNPKAAEYLRHHYDRVKNDPVKREKLKQLMDKMEHIDSTLSSYRQEQQQDVPQQKVSSKQPQQDPQLAREQKWFHNKHQRLAHSIADKLTGGGQSEHAESARDAAQHGLMHALSTYNPAYGSKFSTHAANQIKGHVMNHLSGSGKEISESQKQKIRNIERGAEQAPIKDKE